MITFDNIWNNGSIYNQISEKDPISYLGFPTRVENALIKGQIYTINDLVKVSEGDLLRIKNFGFSTVKKIIEIKEKIKLQIVYENSVNVFPRQTLQEINTTSKATNSITCDKNVTQNNQEFEISDSKPTEIADVELINNLFNKSGSERSLLILTKRYGLKDGKKETLDMIGGQFNITRERVRQIIKQSLRKMSHPSVKSRGKIKEIINNILNDHHLIINNIEADMLIPKEFPNFEFKGSMFMDLLCDLGLFRNYFIGRVILYSTNVSDGCDLFELIESIEQRLYDLKYPLALSQIISYFNYIEMPQNASRAEVIKRCLNLDPKIKEIREGYYGLSSNSGPTKQLQVLIENILDNAQIPLHFTEISSILNDQLELDDKHIEIRHVHKILIDDKNIAHTGIRGTYGLTKWGLSKKTTPELIIECLQKYCQPMDFDQIYNYVTRFKKSPKLNIQSVLTFNKEFEKLSDEKYGLKEWKR